MLEATVLGMLSIRSLYMKVLQQLKKCLFTKQKKIQLKANAANITRKTRADDLTLPASDDLVVVPLSPILLKLLPPVGSI